MVGMGGLLAPFNGPLKSPGSRSATEHGSAVSIAAVEDDPIAGQTPGPPAGDPNDPSAERTSGLLLESCYRHPGVKTGVHCTRCDRPICPDCMYPAAVGYQCPECVAEARRGAPRRRWRVRFILGRPGIATTTLMAVNLTMFVVEIAKGGGGALGSGPNDNSLINLGALQPGCIAYQHQYWRLITVMFLHASLLHIAFNMYALYLFGFLIEGAFGKARFLAVYFVSGFLAGVTSFVFSDPRIAGVGASGAIFGLLGAWVAYNYRRRGTTFASAQLQWALMLIGINLFLGFAIPNIDNYAHIGGLVSGIAAGASAEGFGPRTVRRTVQVGGLVVLAVLGILLTAYRVSTFPAGLSLRC
jgi:membrane associated rhomboid family serine protease